MENVESLNLIDLTIGQRNGRPDPIMDLLVAVLRRSINLTDAGKQQAFLFQIPITVNGESRTALICVRSQKGCEEERPKFLVIPPNNEAKENMISCLQDVILDQSYSTQSKQPNEIGEADLRRELERYINQLPTEEVMTKATNETGPLRRLVTKLFHDALTINMAYLQGQGTTPEDGRPHTLMLEIIERSLVVLSTWVKVQSPDTTPKKPTTALEI